eukprot:7076972-Pyramimonas_sp.AAC.1
MDGALPDDKENYLPQITNGWPAPSECTKASQINQQKNDARGTMERADSHGEFTGAQEGYGLTAHHN